MALSKQISALNLRMKREKHGTRYCDVHASYRDYYGGLDLVHGLAGLSIASGGLGVGLSFWTSVHTDYSELILIHFLEVCLASGGGDNTCGFVDFTLGW